MPIAPTSALVLIKSHSGENQTLPCKIPSRHDDCSTYAALSYRTKGKYYHCAFAQVMSNALINSTETKE